MSTLTYTSIPGLQLFRQGGQEMELFIDAGSSNTLIAFTRMLHEEAYGKMDFQYFIGEGFQIWRSHYLMREKTTGMSRGDIPLLELHIPLYGEATTWWDGWQEQSLRRHQFALDYVPFVNSRTTFSPDHPCGTLDFHFESAFLQAFATQYPIVNEFLAQVEVKRRANLLNKAVRFLSPAMLRIVHDIMHFNGVRELAADYYAGQVILLLALVLQRAMGVKREYSHRKYLDASVSVREFIERHPTQVHTGKSLSAYAGVNVSLLHKIFREFHGTTLFDFSQQVRLEHGKVLLRDTYLFIQQIAEECGYPEHTNFTKAFHKRFGLTPLQYRQAIGKARAAK
jgi:AraC-like DNA-binding protein